MNIEKIKEVFSDREFLKELFSLNTPEEAQAVLAKKGVEMSVEELEKLRDVLLKAEKGEITQEQLEDWKKKSEEGELSEDMLEGVAGGVTAVAVVVGVILAVGLSLSDPIVCQ